MVIDIVADDDPRITITFNIPTTDGPIKVSLPRFDFIDEDELDQITEGIDAIDSELAPHRAQRQSFLIQMKPFCTDEQFAAVQKLKLGQLTQMMNAWTQKSAVSLGEYLASDDSSKENTGRQSKRTSSRKDGGAETSDAGLAGRN